MFQMKKFEGSLKALKNSMSHGMDDITNEIIKYGGEKLYAGVVKLT